MPVIKAGLRTADFHFTPEATVIQERYGDSIRLLYPVIRPLTGKDAGEVFIEGTIPANKIVKLYFGQVMSTHILALAPFESDKYFAPPVILVPCKAYLDVTLIIQTFKATNVEELSCAILSALT